MSDESDHLIEQAEMVMQDRMKQAVCCQCGKKLNDLVPEVAEDVTCFSCCNLPGSRIQRNRHSPGFRRMQERLGPDAAEKLRQDTVRLQEEALRSVKKE